MVNIPQLCQLPRLSLQANSEHTYEQLSADITRIMRQQYPGAVMSIYPARNVFEQLFNTAEPDLRLKLYNTTGQQPIVPALAETIGRHLTQAGLPAGLFGQQDQLIVRLQTDKIMLYDVDESTVVQKLKTVFNNNQVMNLQGHQRFVPLVLAVSNDAETDTKWQSAFVRNRQQQTIPLRSLIEIIPQSDYKIFHADNQGSYVPIDFRVDQARVPELQHRANAILQHEDGILSSWSGQYFRNRTYLGELIAIVGVAILLVFCILTAQFESLQQPFIVLLIILLGLAGAVWSLYISHDNFNILSIIGMVVLIGLLDNDSILKIDTMNRNVDTMSLMEAIRTGGQRRLKSQIMTFLTTVLGLLPVLFSGGLGAELQQPLALSIIGGMCVGVLVSWTVIPLVYYWLAK